MCDKAQLPIDTRDACVQVFDRFFSMVTKTNPLLADDLDYVSLAAASAVILSSKLNDSVPLRMVRQPNAMKWC